ncbi:amino acid adenylation domain-containing protein [Crossiella sp. CA-258035]|uniref:non-ribosomal peptide synthetase n=1 Tax=Crossiella sp. CA-258035 TaxID=2981138 RepID=UPI0024BC59AF|nr:amino acid adenylation domain-containing protein [Crossiella sp. CA-258035]WHT21776.1 amino acid adenylation domain-containing protein [Crossiella sp. CA-258035]
MPSSPTADDLRREVAQLVDRTPEELQDADNLIELGLDSIRLMRLAGQWRKRGIEVTFAELAERPSLGEWFDLLSERLAPAAAPAAPSAPAARFDSAAPFPLALMQHAYWVGRGDGQALGAVAAHLYVEFDGGDVDPDRLIPAVRALVQRHGMLRARLTDDGHQRIQDQPSADSLTVEDLRELDAAAVEARLAELREAWSHQILDIEGGQVFALQLTRLPGGRTRLHVDVDMVAADALSFRVLLADLAALYQGAELAPIDYSYPQYLAERAPLRQDAWEKARSWWQSRLPELPAAPDLPLVPEQDRGDALRTVRKHLWLAPADKQRLIERAHQHRITPAMALATVFAEVLAAWSGQPRFLLNLPLFDRENTHADVAKLVGDFTGSVLLDVDLSEPRSFLEDARRLQGRMHTDAAYADYSGVEVLRDLSRANGEQVLAPVVYTSALNLGELFDEAVKSSFGEPVWIISQGPQVLLDAQVTEVNGGLLVNWDIRDAAFPAGLMDAMFEAYRTLVHWLGSADSDWNQPVPALLPESQLAVREAANETAAPRSGRRLHEGFFNQAKETPDAPAVLWGADGSLSYRELAEQARRVAGALLTRGVEPGEAVAVTLPKGPAQIVAVLGVLTAGATYVPVSVEQPAARRERIHARAGVRLVLDADRLAEALRAEPVEPLLGNEEVPAYVLFTSGSTGEPKGVEVPHRAAMNTIDDLNARFEVGPADRTLGVSALDFDLSVFDIFGPLSVGGAIVLVGESERREAADWVTLVRERGVTIVNCVPPLLDMLLNAGNLGEGLRLVLLGGDWVTVDLPGRLRAQVPGARFVGLGGTTETAIHSTVCEVTGGVPGRWISVPYGTPLANVRCRVVDARGRDCPDWVAGELWIGGDGVALGYRGDPERTADRFVVHNGQNWYRTGDLGRYWPDGTLEFLGRRDHQVKLRGFRIELGEVESALGALDGVGRAIAGVTRAPGAALVAAVAASGVTGEELRERVRDSLPPHMVPERVLVLAELPLTANGKIDRRAVQKLWAEEGTSRPFVPPRTALEKVIAGVWHEVLGGAEFGLDDDFFQRGGDSVLATTIVSRLREALDTTDVSVKLLFATLSVGTMAAQLAERESTPGRLAQVAEIYLAVQEMSADEVEAELSRTAGE